MVILLDCKITNKQAQQAAHNIMLSSSDLRLRRMASITGVMGNGCMYIVHSGFCLAYSHLSPFNRYSRIGMEAMPGSPNPYTICMHLIADR